ncbi:pyruvate, phosphate dikinase [Streptomyces sp.]|uniref:pyruvate, phosphate dikinase n=1 Tax=Streptomyces sp. TaxID=1931 RepID=UPI0039C9F65E
MDVLERLRSGYAPRRQGSLPGRGPGDPARSAILVPENEEPLPTQKFVYDFTEGNKDLKDLLGGKGANLAEMTNLGLPVPPGFTITTEACKVYLESGSEPPTLRDEVSAHLEALEQKMGKKLGQADNPLLVSVRSGAKFSMPGMMDTVLNIGLSDASVAGLAAQAGDERFAWDSYRRLIQMFGKTVLGVDGELFEEALEEAKRAKGAATDVDLDAGDLKQLVERFKTIVAQETGREFPQDPREQMDLAIRAVFDSWNGDRAKLYRRQERIPHDLGTAVNVCSMVFGNLGPDSGTGVAFTRDPASGQQGVYGDYLANAQGEDVVAGIRNTVPLSELERIDKASYDELLRIMEILENHYRDLCDIEFTIERGKLWMLQTRVGKRTAAAAFRIATQLVDQGLIDEAEALRRVNGAQLAQLMFPRFDESRIGDGGAERIGWGIAASPGAAVGKAVFDSYTAIKWSRSGEKVILIRRETNPDDLDGMIAAEGILTSRGGKTSHAAVVARGMGKTCVCGAEELEVDTKRRCLTAPGGVVIEEGDVISIDGSTGKVYRGEVPVVPSPVVEYFEGRMHAGAEDADELVKAVHRIMAYADRVRRLRVRANADNAEDALRARRFGAQGIGLCRTEHMFLGERRELVERLILADTEAEREEALAALMPLQKGDFIELFEAMDGLPVTVRLLDPPLHEFLPDITELSVRVALAEARKEPHENELRLLQAVHRLHEQNPMLGLRGVRLGLVVPGLFTMQVRAIAEAAAERRAAGGDPRAEIMIPLVGTVQELEIVREEAEKVIAEVEAANNVDLALTLGTMIELPRAALTAGQIAESADFFSFGTNDLTQTVWGFSRDDVEASFFTAYLEKGIFGVSPFETIDKDGVGSLVRNAVAAGRATRPDLKLGVCGEHGGDPESVHFFHEAGLDYVSCSPFRIPVARLEAGRAAVVEGDGGSDSR